jgi:hypothetical protein
MLIRFTKGRGKSDTLTFVRADGSCTWAALNGVGHDFGHYAIETTLNLTEAFYGLLAQGWDIADFGQPDPETGRKSMVPVVALQTEVFAGLLDVECRSTRAPSYTTFAEMLMRTCAGLDLPALNVTSDQLAAIRLRYSELLQMWEQLSEGESLELPF